MTNVDYLVYALIVVSAVSILASISARKSSETLPGFLLGGRNISTASVSSMLGSMSFSLNGMVYQMWLGYTIGTIAIIIQFAWTCSFFLLSRHHEQIAESRSFHSFLGERFGRGTMILAAILSIVGFTIMLGWEFGVARETIGGMLGGNAKLSAELLVLVTVIVAATYSALGGIRANAISNLIQNIVKFLCFGTLLYLAFSVAPKIDSWVPSLGKAIAAIGAIGLLTNIAFSLAWQFVDMSTWYAVTTTDRSNDPAACKKSLWYGGIFALVAPGILGTLLGMSIPKSTSINPDNVFSQFILGMADSPFAMALVSVAIFATVLALVDGVLLSAAYALVADIIYKDKADLVARLVQSEHRSDVNHIDANTEGRIILVLRISIFAFAIIGALGIQLVLDHAPLINIFTLVYVLIVAQLSLFGPVIIALRRRIDGQIVSMVPPILGALFVGVAFVVAGLFSKNDTLLACAGTFTIIASFLLATRRLK